MSKPELVPGRYLPQNFAVPLRLSARRLIEEARREIWLASREYGGCFFLDLTDKEQVAVNKKMTATTKLSKLAVGGGTVKGLKPAFIKYDTKARQPLNELHLDANVGTGMDDPSATEFPDIEAWRMLINLHEDPRELLASLENPAHLELENRGGIWVPKEFDPDLVKTFVIPGIEDDAVYGLQFCASAVMHRGNDGSNGMLLLSHGLEVPARII